MLKGNILITGGTGFIGRAIMRRAHRDGWNAQFTIVSRDEEKQAACRLKYPRAKYWLGDILDTERLALLMSGHDYVIHAAALKFIPEGEFNAPEVVRVNIDGARSVITAATAAEVRRVVGISTDKAVAPANIYGMSKAVMERLFTAAGVHAPNGTVFTTCRYGNVLGSTGSVVPVMKRQRELVGHVSVTDPLMTRFWMRPDEAVDVIVAAASTKWRGSVAIPTPRATDMHQLAHAVIAVNDCGDDLDRRWLDTIGMRPGEKKHETLIPDVELSRISLDGGYYFIMPPGDEGNYFTSSMRSDNVGVIGYDELVDMIHDAETV
jgi:UDP-N-acetylglucosamine 4,6-dehydratase